MDCEWIDIIFFFKLDNLGARKYLNYWDTVFFERVKYVVVPISNTSLCNPHSYTTLGTTLVRLLIRQLKLFFAE